MHHKERVKSPSPKQKQPLSVIATSNSFSILGKMSETTLLETLLAANDPYCVLIVINNFTPFPKTYQIFQGPRVTY